MVTVGLLVRVEAKPGKEQAVADFLAGAQAIVEGEPGTTAWFAVRFSDSSFGIFDVFPDDESRQAHLTGAVGQALMANAEELLSAPPSIEHVDLLGSKLPD